MQGVKQISGRGDYIIFITEENELYFKEYGGYLKKMENAEINNETIMVDYMSFITNSVLYQYNNGQLVKVREGDILPYYNKYNKNEFLQTKKMYVYKTDNEKIYIVSSPDITKLGEKTNYNLRKVFSNVMFVNGKGKGLSIVDRNGKVYESARGIANSKIENAKKIIMSNTSKYVIKNDGTLLAKGNATTGMWGEYSDKWNEYIEITMDGTKKFDNVKNIFTSKVGQSAIFITNDNKIYWAGNGSYIILPELKYDYKDTSNNGVTNYPKEVVSNMVEQIRSKIKDISYSYMGSGGIGGRVTLILTEDGKIYTMSDNKNMSGNNTAATNQNGDFTELTIKEGTTVKQILTEDGLSLALLSNGEVYGWGYNTYGILGPSYEVGGIYPTPVKLEGLPANIRYMSLGNGFAIFASKSGEVYGIGKNDYGQLGTGDSIGRTEFVRCTKLEE